MKRTLVPFVILTLGLALLVPRALAAPCAVGGHNETSEVFTTAAGGWAAVNMTPGSLLVPPTGSHLLISEVAPRGAGTGTVSDSSEYVEIVNPTALPIGLDNVYLGDDRLYYQIVNGPYTVADPTDWVVRFPSGLSLLPGQRALVCVTKQGFAGSGANPDGAQYFLEMRDTNGQPGDDMVRLTPNSAHALTGGSMTNPSTTNGEWIVLFCWDGVSDLVADLDLASWGAASASNPRLDKTGIAIDGPDADAIASVFLADTPGASQTSLGTALTKPLTWQRTAAGEIGEAAAGGNGSLTSIGPVLAATEWTTLADVVRFHLRWRNPSDVEPTAAVSGSMRSQEFGAFLPSFAPIGAFDVPPLAPSSFFDVFFDVPLVQLPPPPGRVLPGGGPQPGSPCPPETTWAGNVDVTWSGPGGSGHANHHFGHLLVSAGGGPSMIHVITGCGSAAAWSVSGLCAGFTATLVNEDLSPAPNPVPAAWTGFLSVSATAATPVGTDCCFDLTFTCNGAPGVIRVCATTCRFAAPHDPTLTSVEWATVGDQVRFQMRWENPGASAPSEAVHGELHSQEFGVFLPDFGTIGTFDVPPIEPESFFDVFLQVPRASLPPLPPVVRPAGGPVPGGPCLPDTMWIGNVDVQWTGVDGPAQVHHHHGALLVSNTGAPSFLHLITGCAAPAAWALNGVCAGFAVTLVNEDFTPAPNPVPPGWTGYVQVTCAPGTPAGTVCCFTITFLCNNVPGVIRLCAMACDWLSPHNPTLDTVDWRQNGDVVRFHMRWTNPGTGAPTGPIAGDMNAQPFGAFVPVAGPIGHFDVPPIEPESFFDVFFDVPVSQLPPEPPVQLPGGGPPPSALCPQDTVWAGNVDIVWSGAGGNGQVNRHYADLLVNPGRGLSFIHVISGCAVPPSWTLAGVCPGFTVTLVNEDLSPAPNPLPAGWTGFLAVSASAATPVGVTCCFRLQITCGTQTATIEVCATTCGWPVGDVPGEREPVEFGIHSAVPNPTSGGLSVRFGLPAAGRVRLELFDLAGHRVRTLLAGEMPAGDHTVRWDGRGEGGRTLHAGAYFLALTSADRHTTRRIVLLR